MKPSQAIPKHHKEALKKLYEDHGVGSTIKHKLKYWESTCPDGYCMSHNPTDKMKVAVFEVCWLSDQFPKDFHFC